MTRRWWLFLSAVAAVVILIAVWLFYLAFQVDDRYQAATIATGVTLLVAAVGFIGSGVTARSAAESAQRTAMENRETALKVPTLTGKQQQYQELQTSVAEYVQARIENERVARVVKWFSETAAVDADAKARLDAAVSELRASNDGLSGLRAAALSKLAVPVQHASEDVRTAQAALAKALTNSESGEAEKERLFEAIDADLAKERESGVSPTN